MNRSLAIILLALSCAGGPAGADVPATMRVDYFHSGNHEFEMFSLDQVVVEPLPWPGNMACLLYTSDAADE